jgi:glycerol uptake facilitator-like aquaporin
MLEFRKFSLGLHSAARELPARRNGKEDRNAFCLVRRVSGHAGLVLLGNGVNAGVTLRKSYAADAGWMVIATGWALAVLCGVLVAQAFGSSGAHLNPAITLAAAVVNSGDYSQLLYFWSAQLLGAMAARR